MFITKGTVPPPHCSDLPFFISLFFISLSFDSKSFSSQKEGSLFLGGRIFPADQLSLYLLFLNIKLVFCDFSDDKFNGCVFFFLSVYSLLRQINETRDASE